MATKTTVLKSTLPRALWHKLMSGQLKLVPGKLVALDLADDDPRIVYPKGTPRSERRKA